MEEIEAGAKISLLLGEEWVTGTYLSHVEQFGQDWIIIDIGREKPRWVNAGYIQEMEETPKAEIKPLRKK